MENTEQLKITDKVVLFNGGLLDTTAICPFKWRAFGIVGSFQSAEQAFQWAKAMKFYDFETASAIMKTTNAIGLRTLGESVKNFDNERWLQFRFDFLYGVNYAKFSQHRASYACLTDERFDGKMFGFAVEDVDFGIGYPITDNEATDERTWRGHNLVGKALFSIRERIIAEEKDAESGLVMEEDCYFPPVNELLGWCDSVASIGWTLGMDEHKDFYLMQTEKETEESEPESEELAKFLSCSTPIEHCVAIAAPELYEVARATYETLMNRDFDPDNLNKLRAMAKNALHAATGNSYRSRQTEVKA